MLKSLGCCTAKTLKDDHGWTVLMWAALAGNVDICAPCLQDSCGECLTSGACSQDMLVKSYDAAADYAALSRYYSHHSS